MVLIVSTLGALFMYSRAAERGEVVYEYDEGDTAREITAGDDL